MTCRESLEEFCSLHLTCLFSLASLLLNVDDNLRRFKETFPPYVVRFAHMDFKCMHAALLFSLLSAAGRLRAFVFLWCSPDLSSLYSVISMVRADSPADKQYSLNSTSLLFSGTSSHHINLPTETLILWENVYGGITASTRTCNNTVPVYCRFPISLSLSLSYIQRCFVIWSKVISNESLLNHMEGATVPSSLMSGAGPKWDSYSFPPSLLVFPLHLSACLPPSPDNDQTHF